MNNSHPPGHNADDFGEKHSKHLFGNMLRFYPTSQRSSDALALILHGFNMKPEKMGCVIDLLGTLSISSLLVGFAGHRGDKAQNMSQENWRNDFLRGFCFAARLARLQNKSLYVVGHSMGCLIAARGLIDLQQQNQLPSLLRGCIYLAPAHGLRTIWQKPMIPVGKAVAKTLQGHLPLLGILFGRSDAVHKDLYQNGLEALQSYVQEAQTLRNVCCPVPTLVLADPTDPLIGFGKLQELSEKVHWNLVKLPPGGLLPHMCIFPSHRGWPQICENIRNFVAAT
ncbi:MAG: alpha/beta fold hydrolase [Myxococcota bacterium]